MKFQSIEELLDILISGRLDQITIARVPRPSKLIRIRMRRARVWDELWISDRDLETLIIDQKINNVFNTILDQVSPG